MIKNIYSNYDLESLLQNTQSTVNMINVLQQSDKTGILSSAENQSYLDILKSMQNKINSKTETDKEEVSNIFDKYDKELEKFNNEMMIYDMFHSAYITNGFFGSNVKSRLRNSYYNAWGNIFSMQAERVRAQSQIAIQTALRQQLGR